MGRLEGIVTIVALIYFCAAVFVDPSFFFFFFFFFPDCCWPLSAVTSQLLRIFGQSLARMVRNRVFHSYCIQILHYNNKVQYPRDVGVDFSKK